MSRWDEQFDGFPNPEPDFPEWDVEDEPDFDDDELGVDPEREEDEDG